MPDIEDEDINDRPNDARESNQALREEIAGNLADQGVKVPKEAIDGGSPSAAKEAPAVEKAAPEARTVDPVAPVSFSKPAKDAIEKLKAGALLNPDEGKALAVALDKREKEINNGFSRLKELKELEPYSQQYAQQGMSVAQVLTGYHQAEQLLQTDFVGGLGMLCERYGINPQALVTHLAQRVGLAPQTNGQPTQAGMTAQERQAVQQLMQHNQSLEREITSLKQQVQINSVRDVASKARVAGSSISGGPATTPVAENNLGLRATLEQGFYGSGRA